MAECARDDKWYEDQGNGSVPETFSSMQARRLGLIVVWCYFSSEMEKCEMLDIWSYQRTENCKMKVSFVIIMSAKRLKVEKIGYPRKICQNPKNAVESLKPFRSPVVTWTKQK